LRVYFGLGLLAVGILGASGAILWSPWPAVVTAMAWGVSGFGTPRHGGIPRLEDRLATAGDDVRFEIRQRQFARRAAAD
jgi:hypothetical protein